MKRRNLYPVGMSDDAVQLTVRIPKPLHDTFSGSAEGMGVSLNSLFLVALAHFLEGVDLQELREYAALRDQADREVRARTEQVMQSPLLDQVLGKSNTSQVE